MSQDPPPPPPPSPAGASSPSNETRSIPANDDVLGDVGAVVLGEERGRAAANLTRKAASHKRPLMLILLAVALVLLVLDHEVRQTMPGSRFLDGLVEAPKRAWSVVGTRCIEQTRGRFDQDQIDFRDTGWRLELD